MGACIEVASMAACGGAPPAFPTCPQVSKSRDSTYARSHRARVSSITALYQSCLSNVD